MKLTQSLCAVVVSLAARTMPALAGTATNPAMTEPDRFAWQMFAEINRASANGTRDVVWETWADQRLVYRDPNTTPVWPPAAHAGKELHRSLQQEILREETLPRQQRMRELLRGRDDRRAPVPEILPDAPLSQETRMNRAAFDFVVANRLWYQQGQIRHFQDGKPIVFPPEAREIKAEWKPIVVGDKPRYHWQTASDGKDYGLTALHITSRDVPNWFWATFEHVDNPKRCRELACRDAFGLDAQGQLSDALRQLMTAASLGDVWRQYRLTGTQVDFVDATGRPTILGNSIIEDRFVKSSSCITCHSRSTINGSGGRLDVFDPSGNSHNGAPDPSWFWTTSAAGTSARFLQLDFVWSLALAGRRSVPE